MASSLDFTHDPDRTSWIDSANLPDADFPLTNLPYGCFSVAGSAPRLGVAIGDAILDLHATAAAGLLPTELSAACRATEMNHLLSSGAPAWRELRRRLSELLGADTCAAPATQTLLRTCLRAQADATMLLPATVGDYTDFYASIDHATRVGSLFRPDHPLLPNYKWVPIGYHGRSSSIIPSGTPFHRPHGQRRPADSNFPTFGPSVQLDYELELGAIVGPGNAWGQPIPLPDAPNHLFGICLLNDWSARDIQAWEYQPLGPFLGKNFATTLSPWVITREALLPFQTGARSRTGVDPQPLPYLNDPEEAAHGALDLTLEVFLLTAAMREAGQSPHRLSSVNSQSLYWTLGQLLTHHTSNGCNLRPGDLLGSGTISGAEPGSEGCLLELTHRGTQPISLPNGESRAFLADGDEIILRGHAHRAGFRRIGLGECRGRVLPAR